ncbi:MAG TPA: hypothetical protein VFR07_11550 [Mycobacteriales bacterium]|jgi:hypothetical protein|nr:hypothetical protein [Mycobacteriales bacterium]
MDVPPRKRRPGDANDVGARLDPNAEFEAGRAGGGDNAGHHLFLARLIRRLLARRRARP